MTGNLGKIEISTGEIQTAEIKAITRPLKVDQDVNYPCGAIVTYDNARQLYKPSAMQAGQCFVVIKEKKAGEGDTALCMVMGTVQKAKLLRADDETMFTKWQEITDSDYNFLLNNSNIM